ncbi:MAG: hypothetical protein LBC72_03965 [Spirochaetaceae bacterium]|nr:hypothetical protein [Spirochaetaceae bacterium]
MSIPDFGFRDAAPWARAWLSVVSCQLSVVSCQLSVVGCQLSVVSCQLSVFPPIIRSKADALVCADRLMSLSSTMS